MIQTDATDPCEEPTVLDLSRFEVLSFDCYGTLIDWESGILAASRPVLATHGLSISEERMLELYAELEAEAERAEYVAYRRVLRKVMRGIGARLGFEPTENEADRLAESIRDWRPFADTVAALAVLKRRYKLAIISNIDDDLFAASAEKLAVTFDWVITAEQVRSYKPSAKNFHAALRVIGVPAERLLHVAQSLFHDIAPCRSLGISSVWVNRRAGVAGCGATPAATAIPDLEVPDLQSLAALTQDDH